MKIRENESGQVLVLTALSMVVLLGFVGLATDVGVLFRVRHNLQIATDAAATAGALYGSYGTDPTDAAKTAAAENGVTRDLNGGDVIVHSPPTSGPAKDLSGFVEVVAAQPARTNFMSLFGYGSVTVTARAVAGPAAGSACIYLMNTSGTDLNLQGSGTIEAPGAGETCGVYSNSTSSNSITIGGQANYVNANYVSTVGGLSAKGNSQTAPTPVTTVPSTQTPPAALQITAPTPPGNCTDVSKLGLSTTKITSTTYYILTNAVLSSITTPACFKNGNVMLQGTASNPLVLPDGLYIFTGQVGIGNNVTANGVTLDINGDNGPASENILSVTSTTNVTLKAQTASGLSTTCVPTGGAYCDVLFLAPSSNKETFDIQWGSSGNASSCQTLTATTAAGLGFSGIIDAPGATVSLQDQGGYAMVSGMVVGSLSLKNGFLCIDNYATAHTSSRLSRITLVE